MNVPPGPFGSSARFGAKGAGQRILAFQRSALTFLPARQRLPHPCRFPLPFRWLPVEKHQKLMGQ